MSHILTAMLAIQRDIHSVGVGKFRKNKEQNFNFRGIDDALMAFSPLISEHSVLLNPRYKMVDVTERATKSGSTTYNVRMRLMLVFESAEDGSKRVIGPVFGEANDGQDKAISKAESVALRQALFLAFLVPHEGVIGGDPDGSGERFVPEDQTPVQRPKAAPESPQEPEGLPPCEAWETLYPQWADLVLSGKKSADKVCALVRGKFTLTSDQEAALDDLAKAKTDGAP